MRNILEATPNAQRIAARKRLKEGLRTSSCFSLAVAAHLVGVRRVGNRLEVAPLPPLTFPEGNKTETFVERS